MQALTPTAIASFWRHNIVQVFVSNAFAVNDEKQSKEHKIELHDNTVTALKYNNRKVTIVNMKM